MKKYITIDGGTTNTRVSLFCNNRIISVKKLSVGARIGLENKDLLKTEIKKAIEEILTANGLGECEIERIIASGMITSEGGLVCLDHLKAPCGIEELSKGIYEITISEISSIPFVFIRGVKTNGDSFEDIDMMRGEETELIGLGDTMEKNCLYVMPGSHSKLVYIDENGRITSFSTELTGELIAAVSKNTILSASVNLDECDIDCEYLFKGYEYALENGINSAFFKVRILDKLCKKTSGQVYSFFVGSALSAEINNIIKSQAQKVVVCGRAQLKTATALLLEKFSQKSVVVADEKSCENAPSLGAVRVYENFLNQ